VDKLRTSCFSSKKVVLETTIHKAEDLIYLKKLVEAGEIKT
jgi:hypothetical protein